MNKKRRMIVAGNWKMNMLREQALHLVDGILRGVDGAADKAAAGMEKKGPAPSGMPIAIPELAGPGTLGPDIVICPPFVFLETVIERARQSSIRVGAQNLFYRESGAYTGEVSAAMLRSIGCTYVIIGHSDRRSYFQESDADVNKKVRRSLDCGLVPIVCVGETLAQRKAGQTGEVLNRQLVYGLEGIDEEQIVCVIVAYEPVWAIGTGVSATGEQAEETHRFIRGVLVDFAGSGPADKVRVIYGGSVTAANAFDLMKRENIDGALVGGASLKAESFCEIVRAAHQ